MNVTRSNYRREIIQAFVAIRCFTTNAEKDAARHGIRRSRKPIVRGRHARAHLLLDSPRFCEFGLRGSPATPVSDASLQISLESLYFCFSSTAKWNGTTFPDDGDDDFEELPIRLASDDVAMRSAGVWTSELPFNKLSGYPMRTWPDPHVADLPLPVNGRQLSVIYLW